MPYQLNLNPVLFSIIMPAYNARKYICAAINSLLKQTYSDWELVAVDDGSTDGTGDILEKYANIDPRIKVFHQANSGSAGAARNTALKYISGTHMQMLDSDDLFSNDLLERQRGKIVEDAADIIIPKLIRFNDHGNNIQEWCGIMGDINQIISGPAAFELSLDWIIHGVFTVKTDLIKSVQYETKLINGDEFTTRKLLYNAQKIVFSDGIYHYRFHDDSTTRNISNKARMYETTETDYNIYQFTVDQNMKKTVIKKCEEKISHSLISRQFDFFKEKLSFSGTEIKNIESLLKRIYKKMISKPPKYSGYYIRLLLFFSLGNYTLFSFLTFFSFGIKRKLLTSFEKLVRT
jgi:glycosyltransferase involved in cell wall biosynthesis